MRSPRTVLVRLATVVALLATLAPTVPASAGSADEAGWTDLEHEQLSDRAWISGSWASGRQSWHVGTYVVDDGGDPASRSLVQHCIGKACEPTFPTDLDLPPGSAHRLQSVTGTSPDDVWAVGYVLLPSGTAHPATYHWDGTEWTSVPTGLASGTLSDVSAVAPDDVWAVGKVGTDRTLVLHWDGAEWTSVPSLIKGCGWTDGLAAVAADGRYPLVVGRCQLERSSDAIVAYVARLHPDGSWKRVRVQGDDLRGAVFYDVAWVGRQAWAVGPGDPVRTLHLDGKRWRMEDAPLEGALYSVTGSIRDGVWAVGDTDAAPMRLAMRWDGSQWARVDTDGQGGWFAAVTLLGDGTPYASGQGYFDDSLISRYREEPAGLPLPSSS